VLGPRSCRRPRARSATCSEAPALCRRREGRHQPRARARGHEEVAGGSEVRRERLSDLDGWTAKEVEANVRSVEASLNAATRRPTASAETGGAAPRRRLNRCRVPRRKPHRKRRHRRMRRGRRRCRASNVLRPGRPAGIVHLASDRAARRLVRAIVAVLAVMLCLFPWPRRSTHCSRRSPARAAEGATMIATDVTARSSCHSSHADGGVLLALPYALAGWPSSLRLYHHEKRSRCRSRVELRFF